MGDREARTALESIWESMVGSKPNLSALQSVQAVARMESNYGYIKGQQTNNWGAVQCSHAPPAVPGECIELTVSKPDGTKYQWCYRAFPTASAGAEFLVRLLKKMGVLSFASGGNLSALSKGMYMAGYYGGISKWGKSGLSNDKQDPKHIEAVTINYANGLLTNATGIAKNLGENLSVRIEKDDPSEIPSLAIMGVLGLGILGYVLSRKG